MTSPRQTSAVEVSELSFGQLAAALLTGANGTGWCEHAAVLLLVAQASWLDRWEFRQAINVERGDDGTLAAWVDWPAVQEGPASSGELSILSLACSLAGAASHQTLADLLPSLDSMNTIRLLHAVEFACIGPIPFASASYPMPRWSLPDDHDYSG